MTILEEIGVDFLHDGARELFRKAGMRIEENRVRFERAFVMEQVARTPATFEYQARNSAHTVTLGGDNVVTAPVYGPPFVTDLERGRRGATLEDFSNFDKLSQAVEQIHCAGGTTVEPEDLPLGSRHLDMVYSHIRWTDKPFMGSVISAENARDTIGMSWGRRGFGRPGAGMGILASAEMARHYNLPFRGGGAMTSSKAPDAQAAYESMMCMWPTILGRVNFVLHAAGWLESALLASYEKYIIDVEQLRMFEWILGHGPPVAEERLAMDALREVGPGGHCLGAEHTLRNYRTGFYPPWISSTENYDRWQRFGARTADVVAAERWKQVLAEYPDPGIDPAVDEQLKEFIARRKKELGDA